MNFGLDSQIWKYKRLAGHFIIYKNSLISSFVANLKNDVFSKEKLTLMIKIVFYLKSHGNNAIGLRQ